MTDPRVRELEATRLKKETSDLRPGDLVRIHVKVVEGGRERVQAFEGVVLKRTGSGLRERVTVRRVSHAVGIERCFLLHSPRIEKIEMLRRGRVRRARLYYLRERVGRRARVRELRQG